ncbi:PilX N-terminal domain-containing pilus assembly protein [Pseudomonas sp. SCB32]|uniref:pilus assembly PilX family protein n=1 Tax=Pseudomonas sp. SCB32 TaxID=2653853 RepID=UPI0012647D0B|nr:PilX N-terminal domain-containing pilus assembly protein [Pseudomonas sp. SCB32]
MRRPDDRFSQRGASLFVALILLLIMTMLALSGVRNAVIESRITGHVAVQQRLFNDAEAGLRRTEVRVGSYPAATLNAQALTCSQQMCMPYLDAAHSGGYGAPRFAPGDEVAMDAGPSGSEGGTVKWYVALIGGAADCVSTECTAGGKGGTFLYEVNSCAGDCAGQGSLKLRSVYAKHHDD